MGIYSFERKRRIINFATYNVYHVSFYTYVADLIVNCDTGRIFSRYPTQCMYSRLNILSTVELFQQIRRNYMGPFYYNSTTAFDPYYAEHIRIPAGSGDRLLGVWGVVIGC